MTYRTYDILSLGVLGVLGVLGAGCTGRGRKHWKVLQFIPDENLLLDAAKKPVTYVMSLWLGMIAACINFSEKWKWWSLLTVPANMGDTLVSLLENEDCPRMQVVTKGKQQIPKKQFCGWKVCWKVDNISSKQKPGYITLCDRKWSVVWAYVMEL